MNTLVLSPDWNAPAQPFRKTWAGVGNIDQFRWLGRADVQEQLVLARDELGLRHVRACAMYSPEMRVWEYKLKDWRIPAAEKERHANWQLVDMNLDRLLDLGLKPIYTTCFTPAHMTSNPAVCWPDRNPVGMPDNLDHWQQFVTQGLRHHIARYGRDEVRSWYLECWNEPNLTGFFAGSQEDFFRLWSATWRAVKSVDPDLLFGGPSTARGEWIGEFLDWTARDGTPADYLITHVYNNDSESEPLSPFDGPASHRVKDSPHFASGVIKGVRGLLDERGWKGEVHWNEWGRSWFPHDPQKESPLEAAFVVKTMAEASQSADVFAFWCLSDIYDQIGFQNSEFDGHYGMLSLHGLKKPSWHAHALLQRLHDSAVPLAGGDAFTNAIATTDRNGKHNVLVYAYPESVDAAPEVITVSVSLPPGSTGVEVTRIDRRENNILHAWAELGSPASPTRAQFATLRQVNSLQPSAATAVHIENGLATLSLDRPGVALLEFR